MRLVFTAAAELEFDEAVTFYGRKSPELGASISWEKSRT
jgi:hypothetical protein